MERLISGPLKAIGWIAIAINIISWFGDAGTGSTVMGLVFGAGLVWAGRWITAVRHARLQRYAENQQRKVDRLRRPGGDAGRA